MKMKKLNKYLLALFGVACLFFAACDDDVTRDPSPEANPNSTNVYFAKDNASTITLDLDANSFGIVIAREKSDAAQTVALKQIDRGEGLFVVPENVEFAAGENSKTIVVSVGKMEAFQSYSLAIEIDENQTKPYTEQDVYPRVELTIIKEDYVPFAKGDYSSEFMEDQWEAVLEYSSMLDIYRFKNCWFEGYNVTFKWDKSSVVTVIGGDDGIPTGYVDSRYGMVNAVYKDASYDAENKTFNFSISWNVSAGTFGTYADSFQVSEIF